eukprot:7855944-Ditylum_brightwellii.AAC.1
MSPTAAFTSLPNPHINKAVTPNSSHSWQHSQRKYQPRKKTYNTTFAGCPGCHADVESQLNVIDQIMHHD